MRLPSLRGSLPNPQATADQPIVRGCVPPVGKSVNSLNAIFVPSCFNKTRGLVRYASQKENFVLVLLLSGAIRWSSDSGF